MYETKAPKKPRINVFNELCLNKVTCGNLVWPGVRGYGDNLDVYGLGLHLLEVNVFRDGWIGKSRIITV